MVEMILSLDYLSCSFLLLSTWCLACTPKDPAGSGAATETASPSGSSGSTDTGSTSGATGSTDTGSTTDPSDTTDTSSITDPTGATETSDTDGGLPAQCGESDPAVSSKFEVAIDGKWPFPAVSMACVVDSVAIADGMSVTAMTCDDAGVPVPVTMSLAAAPEGDVAWAAGEAVHLAARHENFDVYEEMELELRGADDRLLAAGQSQPAALATAMFLPISVEAVPACGPPGMEDQSYRLDFELEGQPPLSVFSRHRGVLDIDATESFAIDVYAAYYDACCHGYEYFWLLVRRVKTG